MFTTLFIIYILGFALTIFNYIISNMDEIKEDENIIYYAMFICIFWPIVWCIVLFIRIGNGIIFILKKLKYI